MNAFLLKSLRESHFWGLKFFILGFVFLLSFLNDSLVVLFVLFSFYDYVRYLVVEKLEGDKFTKVMFFKGFGDVLLVLFVFLSKNFEVVPYQNVYAILFFSFYLRFFVDKMFLRSGKSVIQDFWTLFLNISWFVVFVFKSSIPFSLGHDWGWWFVLLFLIVDYFIQMKDLFSLKSFNDIFSVGLCLGFIKVYFVFLFLSFEKGVFFFLLTSFFLFFYFLVSRLILNLKSLVFDQITRDQRKKLIWIYITIAQLFLMPLSSIGVLFVESMVGFAGESLLFFLLSIPLFFFPLYFFFFRLKKNIKEGDFRFVWDKFFVAMGVGYLGIHLLSFWWHSFFFLIEPEEGLFLLLCFFLFIVLGLGHFFLNPSDSKVVLFLDDKNRFLNDLSSTGFRIALEFSKEVNDKKRRILKDLFRLFSFARFVFLGGGEYFSKSCLFLFSIKETVLSFSIMLLLIICLQFYFFY